MQKTEDKDYFIQGLPVPETPEIGKEPKPWKGTQVVGTSIPRIDAYERVSGSAIYPSDVILPDMLYGAILGSPHPNALIKGIDFGEAEKLLGVRAIITGNTQGAGLKWPYELNVSGKLFDDHLRFEGDAVAAVAAESPYIAWDALKTMKVKYQILPHVVDERFASQENAPIVHSKGNRVEDTKKYERGDIQKGFAEADLVVERDYRTECELHTPLELHGCVAKWDGDILTIWESTQGVYGVQSRAAEVLGIPLSKVRVIGHYMGGGFGSKLRAGKYTVIAALLAKKTGRPVKLFHTREQTFLCVGNRPPSNMKVKIGVKKDGTLTAIQFIGTGTGGAFPAGGTSLLDWLAKELYLCPNVQTELTDYYTHTGPARPFRAPGHPQTSWALEQILDEAAEKLRIDPVSLRLKNIPLQSQARQGNPAYTSTGLKECLELGAKTFNWAEEKKRKATGNSPIKRGIGMAACTWYVGGGGPPSTIIMKLFSDGSANLNMGASDIGTGTKTIAVMIAAEELGIKPENIRIENADTFTTQYATPSGGSKTLPTEGPATRAAAVHVKQQLMQMASEELKVDYAKLAMANGEIYSIEDPNKKIKLTQLANLKKQGVIVGVGYRSPNPKDKITNPFGAQFCELTVNTNTGEIEIQKFVAAHDSGRVINKLTFDSQVIGGIVMGIGFGLTEARVLDVHETGKMCNRNWHDYKIPTSLDVPPVIESIHIDLHDSEANSIGAKGLGEPVTIPTAAAIANAVYDAIGIRVTHGPITPMRLSQLIAEKKKG